MTAYLKFKRKNANRFFFFFFLQLLLIKTATAQVTLENDQIKLVTDGKHIISLYDKVRKLEHVTSDYSVANGLFGVSYVDTVTLVVVGTLNSSQVTSVTNNKVGNEEATFKYDSNILTASVTVKLKPNEAEAAWTISLQLKNKAYAFSQVDFPRYRTAQSYGGEFKKFVDPNCEGRIYSMNKAVTTYSRFYPAGQGLQLSACISKGGGVAIWCNDTKGQIKSFGFLNNGTASHLGVRHLMPYGNLKPGQGANWSTDYETILSLCGNSWEDAAEIYRNWALKQTWSETPLKHRTDVPAAFHNSPLTISSMLTKETISSLPSRLKAWADKFNTHIIYRPLEWEKYGSWAGIDYFPSGIGDENFIKLNKDLNKINITTAGFIESYHWTYHIDDATAEQNSALLKFYTDNKGKELSRTMANGSIFTLTSDEQTKSFLCRGTELGKTMIQNVAIGLFDRGVNLVHNDYDHLIGGGGPCFNKAHGHPIPYGWEMDVMMKVYSDISIEGKSRKLDDFSVSKEWPCELLNMTLHCYQARNWKIISSLKETIPLFIYVYHDYIPVSYGLPSGALDFAASIVYGEMQSLRMVNSPVSLPGNGNRETILADYYESMKIYAKEFLLYGRLLKPAVLSSPGTLHNTWQNDQGNIAIFAIDTLETNTNIAIKVPGTLVKYMSVYTGKTLISTKQVKGGDTVILEIPKWRLCSAIFTDYPLSINALEEKGSVKFHPNPVTTVLYIEATTNIKNMEVNIFDSTGKSMGKFNKNTIDFQNFDSGVYIISIKSNNQFSFHKVIKQEIN